MESAEQSTAPVRKSQRAPRLPQPLRVSSPYSTAITVRRSPPWSVPLTLRRKDAEVVHDVAAIRLARYLPCVPEMSANKHVLNIRFVGVAGM
jgi:hypothetical protein